MIISRSSIFMLPVLLLISHVLLLLGMSCHAKKNHLCAPSSCGEIRNISYPFRLKGDPKNCGNPLYELVCENNRTVLYLHASRYYVKSIHYSSYRNKDIFRGNITVVDDGLQKNNCSSLPRYSLACSNLSTKDPSNIFKARSSESVAFMKCSQPITSTSYIDTKPCIEGYPASTPPYFSPTKVYSYAVLRELQVGDIKDSCTVTMMAFASDQISGRKGDQYGSLPYKDLHNKMVEGFTLSYPRYHFQIRSSPCYFSSFVYRREDCGFYYRKRHSLKLFFLFLFFLLLLFLNASFTKGSYQNLLTKQRGKI